MEHFSGFVGWIGLLSFSCVALCGLLLKFGKLKATRSSMAGIHRIATLLTCCSVPLHYATAENRPSFLLLLGIWLISIPVVTFLFNAAGRIRSVMNYKLMAVPLLAIGLFFGHLAIPDEGHGGHHENSAGYEHSDRD